MTNVITLLTSGMSKAELINRVADLWNEAENWGTFKDTKEMNITYYENWTIYEDKQYVKFTDSEGHSLRFKKTGNKYHTIELVIKK